MSPYQTGEHISRNGSGVVGKSDGIFRVRSELPVGFVSRCSSYL